jgi:flagellar basal-body rod protein FlgF
MLRGMAAAASAMVPRIRRQEVIANNLANVGTAGFKRDRVFERELGKAQAATEPQAADWMSGMQSDVEVDFSPGQLEETGNPLDLAIDGDAFFVVSTADGERYTRDGHMALSPDGVLSTPAGDPLAGTGGEIRLTQGTVAVGLDGSVSVDGLNVGALRLVRFDDPTVLARSDSSLFEIADPVAQPEDTIDSTVRQGFLERSNVGTIDEMVEMIAAMRGFEADQKSIQTQDESFGKAVNELGRLRG